MIWGIEETLCLNFLFAVQEGVKDEKLRFSPFFIIFRLLSPFSRLSVPLYASRREERRFLRKTLSPKIIPSTEAVTKDTTSVERALQKLVG